MRNSGSQDVAWHKRWRLAIYVGVLAAALALLVVGGALAAGTPYDLTVDTYPASDGSETINGAIWQMLPSTDPTGSGVFETFLRVQNDPQEEGYNTDYRPLQFDEVSSATHTHSILLADVPKVEYPSGSGHWYREFQLDINEKASNPQWYISLDMFQVWTTNDPNLHAYNNTTFQFAAGTGTNQGVLVYDLDGAGDSWIKMDYRVNPGSGKRDYKVLVPESNFDGKRNDYVVLYTRHGFEGGDWISGAGFEEWGVAIYPEEPNTEVTIASTATAVVEGQTVDLTVTESNTGNTDLVNVSVDVTFDSTTLATLDSSTAIESMTDDNILEVGETWTWDATTDSELDDVVITSITTFYATGYGETESGTIVTYPAYPTEQDSVRIDSLSTIVDISSSAPAVVEGGTVDLTVTEENDGSAPLSSVSVVVNDGSTDIATLVAPPASGDDNTNNVLDPGETWSWTLTSVAITGSTTFTATGSGTYMGVTVTYPGDVDEQDQVTVEDLSTIVSITPDVWETYPGGNVRLTVTETNDGSAPLENVEVIVNDGSSDIATLDASNLTSGDTNANGKLDPTETWTWDYTTEPNLQVSISTATTFTAYGSGEYMGVVVNWTNDPDEEASARVEVAGATRTLGFWQTHLDFTTYVFTTYLGSYIDLGYKQVTSMEELMGIFWANNAKESDGDKRNPLCKARQTTAQQALAAILNNAMPGGAPLPPGVTPTSIAATLGGTNIGDIKALNSILDTYNNSGDNIALDPSLPATGRADPKGARDIADILFADCN